MKEATLELYLHGAGHPQVISARLNETLREVLERLNALPEEGQFVFIGESDEAIHNPEAESDLHEPINIELTLEQLELHKHMHVHTHAIHRVEVEVYYNGHKKRRFSPATTIETVTAWAKKKFNIDPSAGADLVLSLRPNNTQPRQDEHLGDLLVPGSCELVFDLVREITPQGWR